MKVGILSDTHFGFAWGTPREDDPFDQAEDALRKLIAEEVDFIILGGDVFNAPAPPPEIWSRAIDVLSVAKERESGVSAEGVNPRCLEGTPIVAIHGTHERRAGGSETALKALEKVGLVIHLHADSVILKKSGEKVAVHGLSGVPERYARTAIKKWSPRPVEGAKNVLLFHQNLFPFIYAGDSSAGLKLSDLPKGFDLYIDGHIHNPVLAEYDSSPVVITGSTVLTQMRKSEQEGKVVWVWEGGLRQVSIKSRPFVYLELEAEGETPQELEKRIASLVEEQPKDALVKVKVTGRLKEGYTSADIALPLTESLVSIDRSLEAEEKKPEIKPLDETATSLLSKKLEELGFESPVNVGQLYKLLVEGELEAVAELVEGSH